MPAPRQIDHSSMSAEDHRFENVLLAAYNFLQTRSVTDRTAEKDLNGDKEKSSSAEEGCGTR